MTQPRRPTATRSSGMRRYASRIGLAAVGVLIGATVSLAPSPQAVAAPHNACEWSLNDRPCLHLGPDRGGVGTRVAISGRITHNKKLWRNQLNVKHPYLDLIR